MTDDRSTPSDPSGDRPASSAGAGDTAPQAATPSGDTGGRGSDQTADSRDTDRRQNRDPEIVREISMEEFQPTGTLTLALIYFVIVILMWVFMYFFEFAGNDPSILG
ncbi:MAG: hypothetical protein U5K31_03020 [Balneolaceae bacterium]|nr:hypothetical protein [Balneolaceae bacterium]